MDKDLKPYIGCKIIGAKPMSIKAWQEHKMTPADLREETDQEGYMVVYEDGYESWSPKATFERAYRLVSEQEAGLISSCKPYDAIHDSKIIDAIFNNDVGGIVVSKDAFSIISRTGKCYPLLTSGYNWGTLEEMGHLEHPSGRIVRVFVDSELKGVVIHKCTNGDSTEYKRGEIIYYHDSHTWINVRQETFDAICALDVEAIVVSEYINTFLADFKQYVFDTTTTLREWKEDKSEDSMLNAGVLYAVPTIGVKTFYSMKVYVDDRLGAMGDTIYEYKDGKRGNTLMTIDINNLV